MTLLDSERQSQWGPVGGAQVMMTNSTAHWAWSGTNVHKRAVLFERQLCLVNDYLKHLAGLAMTACRMVM